MSEERVVLTMTREQALTVERACEILARMYLGQFDMIPDLLNLDMSVDEFCRRRDNAKDAMKLAAMLLYGRNEYQMPNVKAHSEPQQRAWSLYEVLRYTRAWHDNPKGDVWSVMYDKPVQWLQEPLAECAIVERGGDDL